MGIRTKILIVDDSRIFRGAIEESLAGEQDIQIIGSVRNGVKAIEFIRSKRPDLVTLDVEMPDMGGLETLKAIQEINASSREKPPIGVIMVSSFTQKGADITIQALEAGAFDFITKPASRSPGESIEILHRQLVVKIRYFASQRISRQLKRRRTAESKPKRADDPRRTADDARSERSEPRKAAPGKRLPLARRTSAAARSSEIRAILIGVSTGGPKALAEMLPLLCEKVHVPIFIVQHMPETFTHSLANSLDARCTYTVAEAGNNTLVQEGHVYIAPGGKHLLLRRKNANNVATVINRQPPEKGCRPSVDVLFRSAATAYSGNVIAIILTGMGEDGTKGAGVLKRSGAYVIAQDEDTSVVWGMPGSAEASGHVDTVLPLDKIPDRVSTVIQKSGGD